jgi:hypothetical protein
MHTILRYHLHSSLTKHITISPQALAHEFNKPFVTVHHLEAHCVMARLAGIEVVADVLAKKIDGNEGESPSSSTAGRASSRVVDLADTRSADSSVVDLDVDVTSSPAADTNTSYQAHFTPKVTYPFLALLASGGHTSILLCRELGEYQILGGTLDDALGEAFDKAARLLGLKCASSGGAAVEAAARGGDKDSFPMTVPMRSKLNCDFSYAGLKNAFRLAVQTAREREGLDVNSTNAPANQMEESPEIVVRALLTVCLSVSVSVRLPQDVSSLCVFSPVSICLSQSQPLSQTDSYILLFIGHYSSFIFCLQFISYLITSTTLHKKPLPSFHPLCPNTQSIFPSSSLSDTIRQCYSRSMC